MDNDRWTTTIVWLIVLAMFCVLAYSLADGNLRPTEEDLLVWFGLSDTAPDGT